MDRRIQPNNFDLIRLTAALQVVLGHGIHFVNSGSTNLLITSMLLFPGVPAFFFVSGFLISNSWERHPGVLLYAENRARRLLPALWVADILALFLVWAVFGADQIASHPRQTVIWLLAHASIAQHWNPPYLNSFGLGAINRPLWTIPIEMSFYILLPIMYWFGKRRDGIFWLIAAGSFVVLYASPWLVVHSGGLLQNNRLFATPVPWVGMFLLGVLAQRHLASIKPVVAGRFWLYLALYALISWVGKQHPLGWLLGPPNNELCFINFFALAALLLSAAYTKPDLADRFLRRNDLSYGLYIFHMPILNAIVYKQIEGPAGYVVFIALTVVTAALSWFFIEKPVLQSKRVCAYVHENDHGQIGNEDARQSHR